MCVDIWAIGRQLDLVPTAGDVLSVEVLEFVVFHWGAGSLVCGSVANRNTAATLGFVPA